MYENIYNFTLKLFVYLNLCSKLFLFSNKNVFSGLQFINSACQNPDQKPSARILVCTAFLGLFVLWGGGGGGGKCQGFYGKHGSAT